MKAYHASLIFTGEEWLSDHAILVEDGIIRQIIPASSLPAGIERLDYPNRILAPAFIDLQIYGAHDRLLAVYPEADSLSRLNDYCRQGGASLCMPTLATNEYDVFHRGIDAVRDYWQQGGKGVLGLHIEGPWINHIKRGAHIESIIHSPSLQQVKDLVQYGKGVIRIITLAPEMCSQEVVDYIHQEGIVVSAGHSNATYSEAKAAFSLGIRAVTHLYNAMSPLQHRAPGLVGATLDDDQVLASIIPDGHHLDYAALRIACRAAPGRLFVITDAVTETSIGPYQHHKVGDKYEAGGILSGSALTMDLALRNLIHHVGIDAGEAIRMCSLYPARVIGLQQSLGRLAVNYPLNMVILNDQYEALELI